MPTAGGNPGEQRLAEIRELALAYYGDPQMPIYATQQIKVMALAGALGDEVSFSAFATAVRAIHRSSGRTQPMQEIKDYLADLKRVLTARWATAAARPMAPVTSIDQMIDSDSVRLTIIGLLRKHKRGRIWFDDFLHQVRTDWLCNESDDVVEPYNVTTEQMLNIMVWAMSRNVEVLGGVNITTVREAVAYTAYLDHRNVLVDHIRGVPQWDGTKRLRIMMTKGFGARVDDSIGQTRKLLMKIGHNFMVAMIARGLRPGCKADCMPVFIGAQGTLKSTAMAVLGGPFYRVITHSPADKDFYVCLLGCWLGEIAELASIASTRTDVNKIKAMLSTLDDHFREPYGDVAKSHPRANIFAGTGNQVAWMRDETGGRRFWPVICGEIDIAWLTTHRDQLIAEALWRYERGAKWWWIPEKAHAQAVDRHQQVSIYEDTIRERLLSAHLYDGSLASPPLIRQDLNATDDATRWGNTVTSLMVAVRWLGVPLAQAGRLQFEINAVLTRCGWKSYETSVRVAGRVRNVRCWISADPALRMRMRHEGLVRNMADPPDRNQDNPFV